jgi:glutamate synthase (NADPH/NADH) large chain
MGDDTPLAVLSDEYRPLAHYFRQNFSQVTNPPIDPLREDRVMSLKTRFGNLRAILSGASPQEQIYTLDSPVLSNGMVGRLRKVLRDQVYEIDCTMEVEDGACAPHALRDTLTRIRQEAEDAVRRGFGHLILTDENVGPGRAGLPMILATAAVQTHLISAGLRTYTSLNIRTAESMHPHSMAVLIGCGATTVNAYLTEATIADRHARGLFGDMPLETCIDRYLQAIDAGLLKIMSKMGISVISSYRGGFNFEAVGLSRALVAEFFPGVLSRISGLGLSGLQENLLARHLRAYGPEHEDHLATGGFYRFRQGAETHAHSGPLIHMLQEAVTRGDYALFKKYTAGVAAQPPISIRDLMDFIPRAETIPVEDVESINEIRKRFVTPGMSLGALSPEAHKTLNIAMNRIGAKSDSGEGGENPDHFNPDPHGDNADSAIKQVASGRFGVTAEYLSHAREIEIKVAQGAKPGEGGQLPGFKVTDMIARFRNATPGVTLISPPPHHDIYSIEDLAQLIYDLKQINPDARVCVKLVASSGIGTIAAGVAKAKADVILISGHSGGTGASPLTSLKFAGAPWELGLSEANQVLTLNALRHRIRLRTDGGLRTGRDIVIAALLGAEEFGIGTASLVAMGCLMVRQCHSNTCPVGVCTQDEDLRARFNGTPEKVINLFSFLAEEVREVLASLGARSLDEIIGRTDLLAQASRGASHLDDLDLNPLLIKADSGGHPRYCTLEGRNEVPEGLDAQIFKDAKPFFDKGAKMQLTYTVRNTDRGIGTRTSAHIVRRFGMNELKEGQLTLQLRGSAGQSLGAFAVKGLTIDVLGEANDYVGKGLSGATIVLRPAPESPLNPADHTIIGNTVLYGASSGALFASGQAGERFAVRNSGATAVIEGCGANGCEYMTGGTVAILGAIGDNFAAGMTGGMAFVYDREGLLATHLNPDSAIAVPLRSAHWEAVVRKLVEEHFARTESVRAHDILADWDLTKASFVQICPKEMIARLKHPLDDSALAAGEAAE